MTTKKKASKKAKGKGGKFREPGEPIVIGGGPGRRLTESPVWCDFDQLSYSPAQGDTGTKFEHTGWSMRYLEIVTPLGVVALKPTGSCEVTIRLQHSDERIYIHGDTLGVEFKTDIYPLKTGSTSRHESKRTTNFKTTVDVDFEDKQSITLKDPISVSANYLVPVLRKKTASKSQAKR